MGGDWGEGLMLMRCGAVGGSKRCTCGGAFALAVPAAGRGAQELWTGVNGRGIRCHTGGAAPCGTAH
eukprot:3529431-Prymnesium_polylepis.1